MKGSSAIAATILSRRLRILIASGITALTLLTPSANARADVSDLTEEDRACLKCHDKPGLAKTLANGEKFALHVSGKAYAASVHNENSCEDCHDSIDADTHGKKPGAFKSRHELALAMKDSCQDCHKKKFKEYDDSIHAALIRDGSTKAPLCSSCHNPHTVQADSKDAPMADTPCASCHEDIFNAYSKDVHGLERAAKGKAAPICADCHQAHNVKAASLGEGVRGACVTCHDKVVQSHETWLPNAQRHFAAISCPACHSPGAKRRVNLRLYNGADQRQVSEKTGVPQFVKRTRDADLANVGLDERALWSLLKDLNEGDGGGNTRLRGRLEVSSAVEAHQLGEKSTAVKDCDSCHRAGAEAFQSVILTVAGPDGRPLRHGVQKDVLISPTSVRSVSGFYAIGSTRIKLLDYLLVLVVLGSLSVPIVHMSLRWMFRRAMEKREAEKATAERTRDEA